MYFVGPIPFFLSLPAPEMPVISRTWTEAIVVPGFGRTHCEVEWDGLSLSILK